MSLTSLESLDIPAKQWSMASARSPPEVPQSLIICICSCKAVCYIKLVSNSVLLGLI
jgi:hypothetical protein